MRDLIKKILKESEDDLGWAEDIIGNTDIYQLKGNAFINFMNQYFQSHPSPNDSRMYKILEDHEEPGSYMLTDHTGNYFSLDYNELNMDGILDHIKGTLNRYRDNYDSTIYQEFQDLYATLKPLIDTTN